MDQILKSTAADADEAKLKGRRLLVLALNLGSMAALTWAMSRVLDSRGWSGPTLTFFVIYLIGLPWTLLGFWNSAIGFVILRLSKDPVAYTNPAMRITPADSPITTRTAICLCVRNEDVAASFARLRTMIDSVLATGHGAHFDFHVLSDTSDFEIGCLEEVMFLAIQVRYPGVGLRYRRRRQNTGYKAGNLEEFAKRCAEQYAHMIVLDADSVMSGRAMVRLVRAMQANPQLGILQTLVVGRPSESAFTRIFQFGMRHGMRAQTTGSAWWQGSAGPYWGHNAIIRIAPFVAHCQLPTLPGPPPMGGAVLSHDQVEAALMRGAGWHVRVIPDEMESWEENPTNLPDFIKRDLRWCQGNLQYLGLLTMPGLKGMGRFQLVNAIMMYAGAPMNFLMLLAGLAIAVTPNPPDFATSMAFVLYATAMALGFAPRFLGVFDILLSGQARRYGGVARLLAGCVLDAVFTLLIGPVMMIAQTVFICGLAFGRRMIWDAQNREDRSISAREAVHGLWPQMAFGLTAVLVLAFTLPGVILWAALTLVPCLIAAPFTCVTSARWFGRLLTRARLCAIPDELAPAWELLGGDACPVFIPPAPNPLDVRSAPADATA
ncbi:MAG: glycosyl transferase family 2 [Caulobacteraceae bacterium]|nr:glycosyl transferase family 2 [Caulobacteraceae bacterium]